MLAAFALASLSCLIWYVAIRHDTGALVFGAFFALGVLACAMTNLSVSLREDGGVSIKSLVWVRRHPAYALTEIRVQDGDDGSMLVKLIDDEREIPIMFPAEGPGLQRMEDFLIAVRTLHPAAKVDRRDLMPFLARYRTLK
ncbi:hypothetical protein BH10PSE7_BH10PSE7_40850 [soil metagenome]